MPSKMPTRAGVCGTSYWPLLLVILLEYLNTFAILHPSQVVALSDDIPITDGYANLQEGNRLFQSQRYDEASAFLWRAVLLHGAAKENVSLSSVSLLRR